MVWRYFTISSSIQEQVRQQRLPGFDRVLAEIGLARFAQHVLIHQEPAAGATRIADEDRVRGIVSIARQTGSTFGEDVKLMLDSKLTFDEIKQSPDFGLMSKSRLSKVKTAIFEQLATII